MASAQKQLEELAGQMLNTRGLERVSGRAKERALEEVSRGFTEGAREAATLSGAAGFAGAGGRTQDVISQLGEATAEQRGATALGYDQALLDAIFGRQQAAAGILGNLASLEAAEAARKEAQPQWYDYLIGAAGPLTAIPGIGPVLGGAAALGGTLAAATDQYR